MAVAGGVLLLGGIVAPAAKMKEPAVAGEAPVTAVDHLRQPANNSPMVVVDPSDERRVVVASRLDAPDFGCALNLSTDGGRSWVPTVPVPVLPEGAEKCYGPEVAFDRSGTLHLLFVGLHTKGNLPMGAFLTTSTDHGRSFGPPRRVLEGINFAVRLAVDQESGRLHMVWVHAGADPPLGGFPAGANPIMAAHSDDGGQRFSEPVVISDAGRSRVVAPALTLGPDHAVHVAYYDLLDDARDYQGLAGPVWEGSWAVVVTTSLDGGASFSPGSLVDDGIVPPERPTLIFTMPTPALVAGRDGVCTAWSDQRHGDSDILGRCSRTVGRTWEALVRVNDDPVGNGVRQYLPRLSMAPGGRIDAVYLDRRHDTSGASNDVSFTWSDDGGVSFAPARRLTAAPSSPRIGQRYAGEGAAGLVEIGSRLGLTSLDAGAVAAWPDTRFPAVTPRKVGQDVLAARVRFPSSDPSWPRPLGGVMLLLGLAAGLGAVRGRRLRAVAPLAGVIAAASAVLVFAVVVTGGDPPLVAVRPQVVDVTMTEFRFAFAAPAAPGRTVFTVRNAGTGPHQFSLNLLDDDLPPIDAQLHGKERRPVQSPVELPAAAPGQVQTFAADLAPGQRYAFLCFFATPDRPQVHALQGMNAEFRTAGEKPPPPTTTVTTP